MHDKDTNAKPGLTESANSFANKKNSLTDKQIIDKLLNYIMKDKHVENKEKLLEALISEEAELEESLKSSKKVIREKDSLLMESVLYNQHSSSYKDIHHDDSLNHVTQGSEISKVNMTEDASKNLQMNEKSRFSKDRKIQSKLVERSSTSHKKIRPKSSKGLRGNHSKVNTMSNFGPGQKSTKNKKVTNYLNSNFSGNQLRGKQVRVKKSSQNFSQFISGANDGINYSGVGLEVRPNSSADCRNFNAMNK